MHLCLISDIDNMKKGLNNKAFTLSELVVTLVSLLLFMGLLYPVVLEGQVTSKRTLCQFNLQNFFLATELYSFDNDGFTPAPSEEYTVPFWTTSQWKTPLSKYLTNSEMFTCPSLSSEADAGEYGSYAYSMSFYHSPEQINSISGYCQLKKVDPEMKVTPQKLTAVAKPDSKIIFGEWHSNHAMIDDEKGWWNWSGKRNFVFSDGHSAFISADEIKAANDELPDANVTIDGIKGSDYN